MWPHTLSCGELSGNETGADAKKRGREGLELPDPQDPGTAEP